MIVDPEFAPLGFIPEMDLARLPEARMMMAAMAASRLTDRSDRLRIEDRTIAAHGRDIPLRIYRPKGVTGPGAMLFFHGGGFVVGNLDMEHERCADYAERGRCIVVSVDYRLAPEFLFPAAHEDGWEALNWLAGQAAALGVDGHRLAVAGGSAGAALAAGLALRARDQGGPKLAFVLLQQPVIDHLGSSRSARTFTDTPFLKAADIPKAWGIYFGASPPQGRQLAYAAAFNADDLHGFPSTCILAGAVDPARDEAIAFAQRLLAADVEVELHLFPGAPHGFELIDAAPATQRSLDLRVGALTRAIGGVDGAGE